MKLANFFWLHFFSRKGCQPGASVGLDLSKHGQGKDMCTSYLSCNCQQVCIHAVQKGVVRRMCFFNVFPPLSSEEDGMLAGWNSRERAC